MAEWLHVEETQVPGFGIVETDDALEFLGVVGGFDPSAAHPFRPWTVKDSRIQVAATATVSAQLKASVHAEFPDVYGIAPGGHDWVTVTTDGLVTAAPPIDTV